MLLKNSKLQEQPNATLSSSKTLSTLFLVRLSKCLTYCPNYP